LLLTHGHKEEAMNWDQIEGKWAQFSSKLKSKWAKLTDDDWKLVGSKRCARGQAAGALWPPKRTGREGS